MRVSLSPQAELDFAAQVRWLRRHSPRVGRRAAERIVAALDLLGTFPEIGRAVDGALREKHVQFGRDGFVIQYRLTDEGVAVERILHGRQAR